MEGLLMASTRRHNARPDARFIARICHYVGLRTLSAIGRPPQPFGMHVCYRNVEMTDSCPGVTEGTASERERSTRKPYYPHGLAGGPPEWLAVQGAGRKGHGLPPEGRAGGARQALGDAGDRVGACASR